MLSDEAYMARALALARRGLGLTSPNPAVGAVVVTSDGVVAGAGYHRRAGSPHAEVHALAAAGDRARGATLFCTLEPCCHTGRTGPCTEQIVAAGIARVVAATEDPNPLVCGRGIRYLRERRLEVEVGVGRAAAERLNEAFFTFVRRHRPFVILKAAVSLDGRIAPAPGARGQLTGQAATRRVHRLRAEVDAIGVGSGTVLVDDPLLTARWACRSRPLARVVFDRRLRTPPAARLFSTLDAGPVIIMTTRAAMDAAPERAAALAAAGALLEPVAGGDITAAMTRLAEREILSLLLEGGAAVQEAAWRAGVVDRVQLYVSEVVLGGRGVPWLDPATFGFGALRQMSLEVLGTDVLIEGHVHRTD